MTNNQTKCGTIYEKISLCASYDERMVNNECPGIILKIQFTHLTTLKICLTKLLDIIFEN